jgi:hypothetical protein
MHARTASISALTRLLGSVMSLAVATGCADPGPAEDDLVTTSESEVIADADGAAPLAQLAGAPTLRVAAVRTFGTGCPPGSVFQQTSPSESTLDLTFASYGILRDASQSVSVKECQVQVRLQSEQRFRVQRSRVISLGSATLEAAGQSARTFLRAYFQGATPAREFSYEEVGPYGGTLNLGVVSNTPVEQCSDDQTFIINTRLVVTNQSTGLAQAQIQGPLMIEVVPGPC